jgi:hypothetical protein
MPEKLNVKVSAGSRVDSPPIQKKPGLTEVINWIKNKKLEPEIETQMINKANRCPHQALQNFVDHFRDHIVRIQKKRNQE